VKEMNKSLSAFMVMASVALIMVVLFFGIAYKSLEGKNQHQEKIMQTEHQLKINQ
jgi:trans-2-enoyl-CoA reductase